MYKVIIQCNATSYKSNFCDTYWCSVLERLASENHFWNEISENLTLLFCLLYLVRLGFSPIEAQCSYCLLHLLCIKRFLILQFIFQC
jgi:hypothetical protein